LSPMSRGCCLLPVSIVVFDSSRFGIGLYGSKGSLILAAFSQGVVGTWIGSC
jgi:hypothetical protein